MSVGDILADAWRVYVLLFRRSIVVAAIVFLGIAALEVTNGTVAAILSWLAGFGGPVLVQGALVLIVRNVHEGRRPAEILELGRTTLRRFLSLLGASIVYALGIFFGLIAFVVPGLIAAARWCLMAPGIMLEDRWTFDSLERSRNLVRGHSWEVFGVVASSFFLTAILPDARVFGLFGFHASHRRTVVSAIVSTITAPYAAHVLSVVYYRLTEPDEPILHPSVRTWPSVWQGPA